MKKTFSFLLATSIILSILYETQAEIEIETGQCQNIECEKGKHYQLELINGLIAKEVSANAIANVVNKEDESNEH